MPLLPSHQSPPGAALIEREYRFVPIERLPRSSVIEPFWEGFRVTPLPTEEQTNTYLDTVDLTLAQQGISFRRRVLPDRAELTLKLKRSEGVGSLFQRPEYTMALEPGTPLTEHPLFAEARRYAGGLAIAPWFTFQNQREGVALQTDAATIHLVWDRLTLPDDPAFVDAEIEAELVAGEEAVLDRLALLLINTYGLQFGTAGKRSRVARYLATHHQGRPDPESITGVAGARQP